MTLSDASQQRLACDGATVRGVARVSLFDCGASASAAAPLPAPPLSPPPWMGAQWRTPVGARVVPTVVLAALRSPAVTPRASALPGRWLLAARPLGSHDARRRCGLSRPLAREVSPDDRLAQAARARRLRRLRAADARNLLVSEAFPEGQNGQPVGQRARTLRVYGYDGARRLLYRRVGILAGAFSDAPNFAGAVTRTDYEYDGANRLKHRRYGDALDDSFAYDESGRLVSADSARYASEVDRLYDAAGRLISESLTLPDGKLSGQVLQSATWTVGYAYNPDNTLASQTYPTGAVVSRSYTKRHELKDVRMDTGSGALLVATRAYDAAGRLVTSEAGNNQVETRSYVPGDYRVSAITVPKVTAFRYTYDAEGRKKTEVNPNAKGGGQTFGYDPADRLTSWTAGIAATQSWNLTKVGDWISTTRDGVVETRVNTAVHEAIQVGPNILSYDTQGNLTRDEHGTALTWDPENRLLRAWITADASESGFAAVASYRYDALGRRIAKTVDGRTTIFVPAGAQTVVSIERAALPISQAALAGDGTAANAALTPASGGFLHGGPVTRINFQPAVVAPPPGFYADTGKIFGVRSHGLSYGWSADVQSQTRHRLGAVEPVELDTLVHMTGKTWSIAVPNGTYQVVVVAGDPLYRNQTNNLRIGGVVQTDPDGSATQGYEWGDFDGYAVLATVTNNRLTIAMAPGAQNSKLCYVEIMPSTEPVSMDVEDALKAYIAKATTMTAARPRPLAGVRQYVYGSYVDEVVAYTQRVNGVTKRYYPHYNHLYSVAALTGEKRPNGTVPVIERYTYDAYGKQTITSGAGAVRAKSAVGFDRGFTGYVADNETGLLYAKSRTYSPALGRFVNRQPWMYISNGGNGGLVLSNYSALPWSDFVSMYWNVWAGRSYLQRRFSLYDFMRNSPGNYLEPYSSLSDPDWRGHAPVAGSLNGSPVTGYFYHNEQLAIDRASGRNPGVDRKKSADDAVRDGLADFGKGVSSVSELLDEMQKTVNGGTKRQCFRTLYIHAHGGYGGGVRMGDADVDGVSPTDSQGNKRPDGTAFGDKIAGAMCDPCKIVLIGCFSSSDAQFVKDLAKRTGCTVVSADGYASSGSPGSRSSIFGTTHYPTELKSTNGWTSTDPSGTQTHLPNPKPGTGF